MADPTIIFTATDIEGYDLQVEGYDDGAAAFRTFRPGALSSRRAVELGADEVVRLQLALAAHLHRTGGGDG